MKEKDSQIVNSITIEGIPYALEYLKLQISTFRGNVVDPARSEKARKAARARWDKAKWIEK